MLDNLPVCEGIERFAHAALGHRDPSMTLTRYAGVLPEDTEVLRTGLAAAERLHASRVKS